MEKEFDPYVESFELKVLGFDEPCFGLYTRDNTLLEKWMPNQTECESYFGGFLAPIYQQTFRWFREKHQLPSWVYTSNNQEYWYSVLKDGRMIVRDYKPFKSYEEAELACLRKLIQIVKEKQ